MKNRHWAWFAIGSVLIAASGLEVAACSDEGTGTGTTSGGHDASKSDSDTEDDTSTGGGDTGTPGDAGRDTATACGHEPKLRPSPDGGVFCPFQGNDASAYCGTNQHCCIYKADAGKGSTCNNGGAACDPEVDSGGADFECTEPGDCNGSGKVCCLKGTPAGVTKDPVCYWFGSRITGSHCATSCAAGEFVVCEQQSECEAGTCTPFATKSIDMGARVQ